MPWRIFGRPGPCSGAWRLGAGRRRARRAPLPSAWRGRRGAAWRASAARARAALLVALLGRQRPRAAGGAALRARPRGAPGAPRRPGGGASAGAVGRGLLGPAPRRRRASAAGGRLGLGLCRLGCLFGRVSSAVSSCLVSSASRLVPHVRCRCRAGARRSAPGRGRAWRSSGPRCSPARRWRAGCAGRRARARAVAMCSTQRVVVEVAELACAFMRAPGPRAGRTSSSRAACGRPGASPRGRACSGTPASSNITRPGLTTATQPSGEPLPEPMRVSAGFFVNGLVRDRR